MTLLFHFKGTVMITLIDNHSPFFDKETAKKYFNLNRDNLDDTNGFETLLKAGLFYNVYNEQGYVGTIFSYLGENELWYLGGYAQRKRFNEVVEAIKAVSGMFSEIYAQTRHRHAVIALLRAGFKWYDKEHNILIRRKENGKPSKSKNTNL